MVVLPYAPTNVVGDEKTKDDFYLLLFACFKNALTSDKLILLGDFNVDFNSA
jgi:hypothetical protein